MTTLFNEQNRIANKLFYLLILLPLAAFPHKITPPQGAILYCNNETTWNGSSWSNGEPEAGKDAIFTANYTFTAGTFTACSINVLQGANVNFAQHTNAIITHNVHVAVSGRLTFESGANLIQTEGQQNSGDVIIKRNSSKIVKEAYTIWSSPVAEQKLLGFSPETLPNRFYTYNTANNIYANITSPATTPFDVAKGYLIRSGENHPLTPTIWEGKFTGTPNTGDITVPLDYFSDAKSYNTIGNPYPSPISIQKFFEANAEAINGTIWLWRKTNNPAKSSYETITKLGYQSNSAYDPDNNTIQDPYSLHEEGVLNTAQGFMVKASAASQNIVFNNAMRLPLCSTVFFRTPAPKDNGQDEISRLWLNVTAQNIFSQVLIGYTAETSEGYDSGYDGEAIMDGKTTLYSIADNKKLSIQARSQFNDNDIVTLGFKTETAGTFTFALDHVDGLFMQGQHIYLVDKNSNTVNDITGQGYTFTSEAGTFEDRFTVVFTESSLGIETPQQTQTTAIVYSNNHSVHVQSTEEISSVVIYDLLGRIIFTTDVNNTSFSSDYINTTAPVIVKITMNDGAVLTKKTLVQ